MSVEKFKNNIYGSNYIMRARRGKGYVPAYHITII
jgi:hypothetical protein